MTHHPIDILYGGGVGMACSTTGELHADQLHGLFAGDTRVLSTYRFTIAGHAWRLLSRSRPSPSVAQWDMQNPAVRTAGLDLAEGLVHCRLRRRVSGALHDDLNVTSYAEAPVRLRLSLQLDADFSDVFEVKDRSTPPRLGVSRVASGRRASFVYERRGFRRALHVSFEPSSGDVVLVGAQVIFDVALEPRRVWRCCVEAVPELDGTRLFFEGNPHVNDEAEGGRLTLSASPLLAAPFARGASDLESLTLSTNREGGRVVAAGAPWFLALFGRDTLVTAIMTGLLGPSSAEGALAALGSTQARTHDADRDAEPGKIAHELRTGELARFRLIPHTPYYGTHDAPALFVLALWNAYRWTGSKALLERHLDGAERALRWCEEEGDEDGDGLLEYRTHSRRGYRNQGWKDAEDAIVGEDGRLAALPIATVELQGYWYAARLAMAELLDEVGEVERAERLRDAARELRHLVERRFWMEDVGSYALALDGQKRAVRSTTSNPGHLLWCGLPSRERAHRVAERLLARDMFTGYGVRTLASTHCRYNPLSYQLGSVWPHDSALLAAGLSRYGLRDDAARLARGVLEAAMHFEQHRLPELFCGFDRREGPPIPYEKANVPQAWAAAAPILVAQIVLGLCPDVPKRRCHLSPQLPDWLPKLAIGGIEIGDGRLDVELVRAGDATIVEAARHPTLEIAIGAPAAPLWGSPVEPA